MSTPAGKVTLELYCPVCGTITDHVGVPAALEREYDQTGPICEECSDDGWNECPNCGWATRETGLCRDCAKALGGDGR